MGLGTGNNQVNPDTGAARVMGPTMGRTFVVDVAAGTTFSCRGNNLLGRWVVIRSRDGTIGYFLRPQLKLPLSTVAPLLAARVGSNPTQQCGSLASAQSEPFFVPDYGIVVGGGANGADFQTDVEIVMVAATGTVVVEIYDANM